MNNIDYTSFKSNALKNSILRISSNFAELNFITSKQLQFKNRVFKVAPRALKDISKMLGMGANSLKNIDKTLGKEISIAIYNNMIKAHAKNENGELLLVIKRTGEIVRVLNKKFSVLSNELFFDIAEKIINTNKLSIHELSISPEGELVIQTKGNNTEFQVKGFKDEVFESGLAISNTHNGLNVDPFMHRLVCTNGMVTKQFDDSITLNAINKKAMGQFFDKLHQLEMKDFKSNRFSDKVIEAMNTRASVSELSQGMRLLTESSNIELYEVDNFVPFKETYQDYKSLGINLETISSAKKKNAQSAITMWDLINGITDFASHNYGYKVKNAAQMQINAGDMLCKQYDIANTLAVSPY